jgi:hypothetical protein
VAAPAGWWLRAGDFGVIRLEIAFSAPHGADLGRRSTLEVNSPFA